MKLDETKGFYQFLGELNFSAAIVIIFLISLVFAFITINIAEKIINESAKNPKRILTIIVFSVTLICGVILKYDANEDKKDIIAANSIKSYLIANNLQYRSLKTIANDVQLSVGDSLCQGDSICIQKNVIRIKEIIKKFPSDFIYCPVYENTSTQGLELVNEQANRRIDSSVTNLLPFYSSKAIYYIHKKKLKEISFRELYDSVDSRFTSDLIERIIASSKSKLTAYTNMDTNNHEDYLILN